MSSISAFFSGSLPGSFVTTPSITARLVGFPAAPPATCAMAQAPNRAISKYRGGRLLEPGFMDLRFMDSN